MENKRDFFLIRGPLYEGDQPGHELLYPRTDTNISNQEQLEIWQNIFPNASQIETVSLTPKQALNRRCPVCSELSLLVD